MKPVLMNLCSLFLLTVLERRPPGMDDLPELLAVTEVIRDRRDSRQRKQTQSPCRRRFVPPHPTSWSNRSPPQLLAFHQLSKNSATLRLCHRVALGDSDQPLEVRLLPRGNGYAHAFFPSHQRQVHPTCSAPILSLAAGAGRKNPEQRETPQSRSR